MLSLTWLVPSVRKPPPEITKKLHRRAVSAQPQEPLLLMGLYEKAKFVPTPEPIYHVSFDEQATVVPPPASESAPSSPRGRRLIPLPRCKSRTVQSPPRLSGLSPVVSHGFSPGAVLLPSGRRRRHRHQLVSSRSLVTMQRGRLDPTSLKEEGLDF